MRVQRSPRAIAGDKERAPRKSWTGPIVIVAPRALAAESQDHHHERSEILRPTPDGPKSRTGFSVLNRFAVNRRSANASYARWKSVIHIHPPSGNRQKQCQEWPQSHPGSVNFSVVHCGPLSFCSSGALIKDGERNSLIVSSNSPFSRTHKDRRDPRLNYGNSTPYPELMNRSLARVWCHRVRPNGKRTTPRLDSLTSPSPI